MTTKIKAPYVNSSADLTKNLQKKDDMDKFELLMYRLKKWGA